MEQIERLVGHWRSFADMPYSDWVLISVGGLLLTFAILRIVRNSVTMLVWVILGGVGLGAVLQGTDRAPWQERNFEGETIAELFESGRDRSPEVLEYFCARLDEVRATEAARAGGRSADGWIR